MCTLFPHRLENRLVCNGGCWRCKLIIAIDIDAKMRLFVHSNSHLTITSFGLQSLFVDRTYIYIYIHIYDFFSFRDTNFVVLFSVCCCWLIRWSLCSFGSFVRCTGVVQVKISLSEIVARKRDCNESESRLDFVISLIGRFPFFVL